MNLKVIKDLETDKKNEKNIETTGVFNDSRKVIENSIFIAIDGFLVDGHKFIDTAIAKGAKIIVHTKDIASYADDIFYIKVTDSYFAYSLLIEEFYAKPAKDFILTGITGTNGKTTTAFILQEFLKSIDKRIGLVSTIKFDNGIKSVSANGTTPEATELQEQFAEIAKNKCPYAVMEVSSHGLSQRRIGSAKFAVAIFSNLTGDHLDYHGTMEEYYQAKKIFFTEYLSDEGFAIINIDDKYGSRLNDELLNKKTISLSIEKDADCKIVIEKQTTTQTIFSLECEKLNIPLQKIETNLIGLHNVYNLTSAILAYLTLNSGDLKDINKMCSNLSITGRLERIDLKNNVSAFIDYAHTDDALDNILKTLKPITIGKLIVLFGAGGDRDKTKRPRMAAVAAKYADKIIITSDNPRFENPQSIIDDVKKGIPKGVCYYEIVDRKEAILKAAELAKPNDIIVLAGKGHENYQIIKDKTIHLSDREEILNTLR